MHLQLRLPGLPVHAFGFNDLRTGPGGYLTGWLAAQAVARAA
jgi:hypothetical protein